MEQNGLGILKQLFASHPDPVVIFNNDWKVLWSNREIFLVEEFTDKLCNISRGSSQICLNGIWYNCSLFSGGADGFQVVVVSPFKENDIVSRPDMENLTGGIQAIISNLYVISGLLEEDDVSDSVSECLNRIESACHRVYRRDFICNALDKMRADTAPRKNYCLNMELLHIFKRIRSIVHSRGPMEFVGCDTEIYLSTNGDELALAVMAAVLLCYREETYEQGITITMGTDGENTAYIEIMVRMLPEKQDHDETAQGTLADMTLERKIMEVYSRKIHGRWIVQEHAVEQTVIGRLIFPNGNPTSDFLLHSAEEQTHRSFFSSYSQMLSKIHCVKHF